MPPYCLQYGVCGTLRCRYRVAIPGNIVAVEVCVVFGVTLAEETTEPMGLRIEGGGGGGGAGQGYDEQNNGAVSTPEAPSTECTDFTQRCMVLFPSMRCTILRRIEHEPSVPNLIVFR